MANLYLFQCLYFIQKNPHVLKIGVISLTKYYPKKLKLIIKLYIYLPIFELMSIFEVIKEKMNLYTKVVFDSI